MHWGNPHSHLFSTFILFFHFFLGNKSIGMQFWPTDDGRSFLSTYHIHPLISSSFLTLPPITDPRWTLIKGPPFYPPSIFQIYRFSTTRFLQGHMAPPTRLKVLPLNGLGTPQNVFVPQRVESKGRRTDRHNWTQREHLTKHQVPVTYLHSGFLPLRSLMSSKWPQ